MSLLAIINEVFSVVWLLAMLLLLFFIWRSLARFLAHIIEITRMMASVTQANTESSQRAAESSRVALETIHNLVALQAKDTTQHE